ncbi:Bug family tripartite tricarboxylate transporter substrate binding protein [Variovorax paradoxus]|uniref:Bug family tripartite tricarboxylate transporter substrate binding protein n=1 Tax=Variovorax paradoxus TaxID=34073 RepID=UPI002785C4E1|nr:tripartite tricarboxylate transporter substrate-binding protein [Variovorax paradoxus]MDQ0589924.1 tripartite-type tricarboxylate transporter receptor subunit TctC [Variovorax paradoxus]
MNRTRLSRRDLLAWTACAVAAKTAPVLAQENKLIEWVVGAAPGGGSDLVARTFAEPMAKSLGRQIVVVNKPGAGTNLAADYVAKARDVEHVLLTADFAALAVNPWLYSKLPYNAQKDLANVGMLVRFPLVIVVSAQHPARTFPDLLSWIRSQGGPVAFASPGAGTPHHLVTEQLLRNLGVQATHVPYRGAAPAVQDVIGGQVPFMLVDSASGMPMINGGKLRALAVSTAVRMKTLPDVPTLQEQGLKGFEGFAWQGLAVPMAAPKSHVARVSSALLEAFNNPLVEARLQALGVEPLSGTPAEMDRFVKAERERWGTVVRDLQLKLD